jgi:hypothetical protein
MSLWQMGGRKTKPTHSHDWNSPNAEKPTVVERKEIEDVLRGVLADVLPKSE